MCLLGSLLSQYEKPQAVIVEEQEQRVRRYKQAQKQGGLLDQQNKTKQGEGDVDCRQS